MFVWIFGWKILVINRRTDIFVFLFFSLKYSDGSGIFEEESQTHLSTGD